MSKNARRNTTEASCYICKRFGLAVWWVRFWLCPTHYREVWARYEATKETAT